MLRKSIGAQRANCQIRQTGGLDASRLKNPQFLHKAINPTIDGERCEQLLKKYWKHSSLFLWELTSRENGVGYMRECNPLPSPSLALLSPFPLPLHLTLPPFSLPPPSLFPSPSLPSNSNKIIFSKPQSRTKNWWEEEGRGKDNIPLTSLTLSAISSPFPPSSVSLVFLLSSPNANLVTLSLIPFLLLHLTYFLIHLIIFILAKPFLYPSIIDILTNLINFIIPIPFLHPSLILFVTLVWITLVTLVIITP